MHRNPKNKIVIDETIPEKQLIKACMENLENDARTAGACMSKQKYKAQTGSYELLHMLSTICMHRYPSQLRQRV
jgi:hypothetical protein